MPETIAMPITLRGEPAGVEGRTGDELRNLRMLRSRPGL
jgi:hypothetical protein